MPRLTLSTVFILAALLSLGGLMLKGHSANRTSSSDQEQDREGFAADRQDGGAPVAIDADRAMDYLKKVCKIGPRISATKGMQDQQELIKKHFEDLGAKVTFQKFTAKQKSQAKPVEMANMIISWNPDRERRIILCSHYDTRPIADQEPDRLKWHDPFISANDGGSGVALLMELGNHMAKLKTAVGVDFVLFDGEEYIFESDRDKYFFGSEHFGQSYRRNRPSYRYIGAVLLDMIAGENASFPVEQNSWYDASDLTKTIWSIGIELKCTAFKNKMGDTVMDDHLALNKAGIPAVDLIDFSYRYWHKLGDLPERCSADSFSQVGKVLTVWMQRVK